MKRIHGRKQILMIQESAIEAQAGDAPTLIRIQTKAGHGFGKPTAILIQEQADMYAFLIWTLGMRSNDPLYKSPSETELL